MTKYRLKSFLQIASASVFMIGGVSFVIACAPNSANEWYSSKKIVISVDGAQKQMYDGVAKAFENTESYKEGYRLEFIAKDVFAAIDTFSTLGFADENVSDLIYAPQDRITDLLQRRSVIKWSNEFLEDMLKLTGATEEEKTRLKAFGSIPISATETSFFAMQHNREGIVMMSNKSLSDARTTLQNPTSDSLAELVAQGRGFFRVQDFWYGNGILGGALDANQIQKILYKKDRTQASWSSGFMKNDANHQAFAKATKNATALWYELWKAGYTNNYATSAFNNKIEAGDIRTLMSNDMNAVQNKVLELMEAKKLEYALVGSWDIFNSVNRNINTFVNVPNVVDGSKYLQASGSWSFLFNARNNSVDPKRKAALEQVVKLIYSPDAYWNYFKQDSKVPYLKNLQDGVITKSKTAALEAAKEIGNFATANGFSSVEDLRNTYNTKLLAINTALASAVPETSAFWQSSNKGEPLAAEAIMAAPNKPNVELLIGATDKIKQELTALTFKETIGLRNSIATLLGLNDIALLKGDGQEWQVGSDLIKPGVEWPADVLQDKDKKTAHMRKLEKLIFGQNGDQADERKALVNTVLQKGVVVALNEVIQKAKNFSVTYAKTQVPEEQIIKAATLYFNAILNRAAWENIVNQYSPILNNLKFEKKDGTESSKTNKEVGLLIADLDKGNVFDNVLNVLTSSAPISTGLGVFETQSGRLDNSNPQFNPVWGIWNDQVFGNAVFMQALATENPNFTQEQFTQKIIDKLDELYSQRITVFNTTGLSDKITF